MRVSGLFPAVQTAASRPTNAEKEGKRKAEKSMHLLRKQKKKEKKYVLQIQKSMHKKSQLSLLPLVKYAPKRGRRPLRGLQNQKKGAKKRQKRGRAGQQPRLSRSARFRRPESGGGVCQPRGWLGCTLYAGSITEAAGAASETGWAALYTHFLPAELAFGVRLVYALFAELCPGSMHTK